MTYTGGLRARLIRDSVFHTLDAGLRALGWYATRATRTPVTFGLEPVDLNEPAAPNTVALSDERDTPDPIELGSTLTELTWTMNVDVFAENDSVGLHLVGDVAAILAGRMPSIGRPGPWVDVYDYTLATPVVIFRVAVERVRTDKAHDFPQPWLRHWRSCSFDVVDEHAGEDDTDPSPFEGYGGY